MHLKSIFVLFLIFIVKATHLYHSFISSSLYLVRCLKFRLPFLENVTKWHATNNRSNFSSLKRSLGPKHTWCARCPLMWVPVSPPFSFGQLSLKMTAIDSIFASLEEDFIILTHIQVAFLSFGDCTLIFESKVFLLVCVSLGIDEKYTPIQDGWKVITATEILQSGHII